MDEDEMENFDLMSSLDASKFELNFFNESCLIITLILNVICILFNVACLIFSFKMNTILKILKYNLVFQYFIFKLIHELITFKVCLMTLLYTKDRSSRNYLKMEYFFTDFSDSNGNFMLFVIWLIIMQERNMIGFIKFSNNNSNETNKLNI